MALKLRLVCVVALAIAAAHSTTRQGKGLHYRQNNDELNIEHIISLWNKSASEDHQHNTVQYTTVPPTTTLPTTNKQIPEKKATIPKPSKTSGNFIDRFNVCVKRLKYAAMAHQDQAVVVRCLKAELVNKLNDLVSQPGQSIKMFHGYMEFQKLTRPVQENLTENEILTEPKVKYSARVSSKVLPEPSTQPLVPVVLKQPKLNQSHVSDYYDSYQKMLKELVARKSGTNVTRSKREEKMNRTTLEKSARLFESGRKLIKEISNNLENGEEDVENFTEAILDPDLISAINNFTKSYSVRLNFYPGVAARMKRNDNSGVTFDLELDDVNEVDETDDGREGKKKNKKKISKKTLKKLFPYLLIPFMIQAALLPFVLKFLLFVAIKALVAGKLALILVAFNAIRNASLRSENDDYIERVSYDHYGYPNGEEYGAWINRRNIEDQDETLHKEEMEEEYVDPYAAYHNEPRRAYS